MSKLQALRDRQLKAFSDKLKSENDAIFEKYTKLKKFVKDQKKRTKKVSKKHEWTQRKSRLQQEAEDAENELLTNCRILADSKDLQFGEDFIEMLSTYERQEGEMKMLSHKVNGIIIAFLSAKNYIFSTLESMHESNEEPAPIEVFFKDLRSTLVSIRDEIQALGDVEEELDQFMRQHNPVQADGSSTKQSSRPADCESVLQGLLDKYVLAESHVKDEVRRDFARLEQMIQRTRREMRPGSGSKQSTGDTTTLPKLPHLKQSGGGSVTSSFMRARNEAAKKAQRKGRKALLKEISDILPHIKYSTLERQNEQFQQQQQQRIRSKETLELHMRELKQVAKVSEEKLLKSSNEAKKKATSAVACLKWEIHADAYTQQLEHCRKEKAIDNEIQAFMTLEDERKAQQEKERREEAARKERSHQKQLLAVYHDEVERKRLAEAEDVRMRKLQEDHERVLSLVETEKRVKFRQQLDSVKMEERKAKEELIKEGEIARHLRLERLAASVAPEVEADPARARAHTFASSSMFEEDGEGRAFHDVHGYFDEKLFQDQRFRITEALRAAGLHATDYGRSVLTDIKSNVQHRPDMRTTYDKMVHR
ncbi:hypothetical protein HOP50_07g49460 [Chloropicon primus]|nr:hypothetical protein HOP50_07g49460 [Chloropicon primus]